MTKFVQTLIFILRHIVIVRLVVHELNKLNIGDRTDFVEVLMNLSRNRADGNRIIYNYYK